MLIIRINEYEINRNSSREEEKRNFRFRNELRQKYESIFISVNIRVNLNACNRC